MDIHTVKRMAKALLLKHYSSNPGGSHQLRTVIDGKSESCSSNCIKQTTDTATSASYRGEPGEYLYESINNNDKSVLIHLSSSLPSNSDAQYTASNATIHSILKERLIQLLQKKRKRVDAKNHSMPQNPSWSAIKFASCKSSSWPIPTYPLHSAPYEKTRMRYVGMDTAYDCLSHCITPKVRTQASGAFFRPFDSKDVHPSIVSLPRVKRMCALSADGISTRRDLNSQFVENTQGLWLFQANPNDHLAVTEFMRFMECCIAMCCNPHVKVNGNEATGVMPYGVIKHVRDLFQLIRLEKATYRTVLEAWTKVATTLLRGSPSVQAASEDMSKWFVKPALMEFILSPIDSSTRCINCSRNTLVISASCTAISSTTPSLKLLDNFVTVLLTIEYALNSFHVKCFSKTGSNDTSWGALLESTMLSLQDRDPLPPMLRIPALDVLAAMRRLKSRTWDAETRSITNASKAIHSHGFSIQLPLSLRGLASLPR